jgi:hypothetical protein
LFAGDLFELGNDRGSHRHLLAPRACIIARNENMAYPNYRWLGAFSALAW